MSGSADHRAGDQPGPCPADETATPAAIPDPRAEADDSAARLSDLTRAYYAARADADAANRTKAAFLANVSHELRTPLNAIIGFAEVMRNEMFGSLGNPTYRDYARDIFDSGNYLLAVIEDILLMARLEAGSYQLAMGDCDGIEIVRATIEGVRGSADKRGVGFRLSGPHSLALSADNDAVALALRQILETAIDHSPAGGLVRVDVIATADAVTIAVTDQGPGLPAEAVARLTEPFAAGETQLNRRRKGAGLGLAIATAVAKLHGGALRVQSAPAAGTTVLFSLPRSCQDAL